MTPEQEAEARALLAEIAKTHEWARVGTTAVIGGITFVQMTPLADPRIAVFKAVLALSKEQADA